MSGAVKSKPEAAVMLAGLRRATKAIAAAEVVEALGVAGAMANVGVHIRTTDPHAAAVVHAALAPVAERVSFSGPHITTDHVLIVHEFAVTEHGSPIAEVVLSVPAAVADEVAPNWRAVAAATAAVADDEWSVLTTVAPAEPMTVERLHEPWCPNKDGHAGFCEQLSMPDRTREDG